MGSVLSHLFETLPFAAVVKTTSEYVKPPKKPSSASSYGGSPGVKAPKSAWDVYKEGVATPAEKRAKPFEWALSDLFLMQPAGKTKAFSFGTSTAPARGKAPEGRWRMNFDPARPNELREVLCRVREAGYKQYLVFDELRCGLDDGGTFKDEVKVVTSTGKELRLPLTPDHLHSIWLTGPSAITRSTTHVFPLDLEIERGMVVAFAYELTSKGELVPYSDPADVGEAALQKRLTTKPESMPDPEGNRWIQRAISGNFLPSTLDTLVPSALVGTSKDVSLLPTRFLVVFSVAACREMENFEPVGVVGMTRFIPHLLVKASVPLSSVEGSISYRRPASSTTRDDGDGSLAGKTCCGAKEKLGAILVADSNEDLLGPDKYQQPFWGGLFAYIDLDPTRFEGKPQRVVDHTLGARSVSKVGTRRLSLDGGLGDITSIDKLARQGQWDNIHVSPKLAIPPGVRGGFRHAVMGDETLEELDRAKLKLDEPIIMAPFCSHDCWHMHWRWSPAADAHWTLGFSSSSGKGSPFAYEAFHQAGAPMIPPSHDLDLRVTSASSFVWSEKANPPKGKVELPRLYWTILGYPGGAFAQGVSSLKIVAGAGISWFDAVTARMGMEKLHGTVDEVATLALDSGDPKKPWTLFNYSPLFYYAMRYRLSHPSINILKESATIKRAFAEDRIAMTRAEVDRARKG